LPAGARAQDRDPRDLDQVVVTATRTATTADAALAAVEVIDRGDIEGSTAHSLPELLRGRAGVTLVNQGGWSRSSASRSCAGRVPRCTARTRSAA
jgi:vitamin B12 transporter